jgi:hypothetical protein
MEQIAQILSVQESLHFLTIGNKTNVEIVVIDLIAKKGLWNTSIEAYVANPDNEASDSVGKFFYENCIVPEHEQLPVTYTIEWCKKYGIDCQINKDQHISANDYHNG